MIIIPNFMRNTLYAGKRLNPPIFEIVGVCTTLTALFVIGIAFKVLIEINHFLPYNDNRQTNLKYNKIQSIRDNRV